MAATIRDGDGQDHESSPVTPEKYQREVKVDLPIRLHREETIGFLWPTRENVAKVHLHVRYSIRKDGSVESCHAVELTAEQFAKDRTT